MADAGEELLRRVHNATRAHVAAGREPVRIGPFEVFREPRGGALATCALPVLGAAPSATDLTVLRDRFEAAGIPARIEYLPRLAPRVEAAARDAGFAVALRSPLMVHRTRAELAPVGGLSLELVTPASSDATIRSVVDVQREAFGGDPAEVDVDAWRARHAGIWVLGRIDGDPAGAGCVTLAHRGAAEIAGIGVRPGYRRLGIAAALTADLARRGVESGLDLVFLTPGSDQAQRIYARAGFTPEAEALHLAAPRR